MWGGSDERESIAAIHAALDAGVNLIDTAPIYGFGRSEEIVGKAICDRRDKVVLATKCGMVAGTDRGVHKFRSTAAGPNPDGHLSIQIYLAPESIREEVETGLRRLKTDHIDVMQTHWQDPTTPIAETMGTLLDLKQEGKIRAVGACNAQVEQLEAYREVGPLDVDQELYSMLDRQIESAQLPFCREQGIAVLAYSPMARGLLTGKIGPDRQFVAGDQRLVNPRFSVENRRRVAGMLERFQPIADERQATLGQLVIAWTLAQGGLTHALCGARTPQQAKENVGGADIELSLEELQRIDDAIAACW